MSAGAGRRLVLAATVLGAFALRVTGLGALGDLDFDEAATAYLAAMDDPRQLLATVLESFYHDPPLFYFLLHWWQAAAGSAEPALRLLPIMFTTLAVAVLGGGLTRGAGIRAGGIAAVVLAVAPTTVVYSRYARMYALLLLCMAVVVAAASWKRRSGGQRSLIATLTAYSVALGNHFYALFPAVVTAPWLVPRWLLAGGLFAGAAAAAVWLASSPRMREIMATMQPRFSQPGEAWPTLAASLGALAGPSAPSAAYLITAVVLVLAALLIATQRRTLPTPLWIVAVTGWLATTLAVITMSYLGAPLANRYLLVAAPFSAALLGLAARCLPRALMLPLLVGMVGGATVLLRSHYDGFTWGDYGQATDRLRADFRPGDGVLLNGMAQSVLYDYYRRGLPEGRIFPGPTLRDPRPLTEGEAVPVLTSMVREHPRIWVVESATNFYDPARIAEQWMDREAYPLPLVRFRDAVLRPYLTEGSGAASLTEQRVDALLLDLRLDTVALESAPLKPGAQGRLRLSGHAEGASGQRKVSARLVGPDGKGIWQSDRFFTGRDRVEARTVIEVPANAAATRYELQAVVYEQAANPQGGVQIIRTSEPVTLAMVTVSS